MRFAGFREKKMTGDASGNSSGEGERSIQRYWCTAGDLGEESFFGGRGIGSVCLFYPRADKKVKDRERRRDALPCCARTRRKTRAKRLQQKRSARSNATNAIDASYFLDQTRGGRHE